MKKKVLGIAAAAAIMSLSTGMTAFAAGWVTETTPYGDKQKYVYDDGSWSSGNWFTDPDTQLVYYLDPDGYRMTETTVEGYWLNADGVRQEKSQEQIERETRERAKKAAKPNPGKKVAADKVAGIEAKEKKAASSTTRSAFISELKTIINSISKTVNENRTECSSVQILTTENNLEVSRYFRTTSGVDFYHVSMWASKKDKPQTVDFMYMYDAAPEADRELYNTAYEQTVVSVLGETEGKKLTDYIQSQREQGVTKLESTGTTDTGNSYTMKYRNNRVEISVTCSEVVPQNETEEAADATTEAAQETTETQATTSGTITAGAAN